MVTLTAEADLYWAPCRNEIGSDYSTGTEYLLHGRLSSLWVAVEFSFPALLSTLLSTLHSLESRLLV